MTDSYGGDSHAPEPEPVTEFRLADYHSPSAGRLVVVTMDNGRDHTRPNTLDEHALDSLDRALDRLEAALDDDDPVRGVMLTGKPFSFAAGADLTALASRDADGARAACGRGHEVFGRLRDLPVPTVAAINGVCLGGGLELALHCDARTLSRVAGPIGFPEVFLSIVPAWGGTQLATRLVGAVNALQVIVGNPLDRNRTLRAAQAHELGFADRIYESADFLERSLVLLEGLATGDDSLSRRDHHEDPDAALAAARKAADDRVHGGTRAPYLAIDLIEHAARGGDLADGLRREEDALAELLPARQARAAIYSFELTQQRARTQPGRPDVTPRTVGKAAVVGAGLMGAQLGSLLLQRLAVPLVMVDTDDGVLERARGHIEGEVDRRMAQGRIPEGRARFMKSLVTYSTEHTALGGSDLVIEAVVENLDVKRKLFTDIEPHVDGGCVLVTNTSALSVTSMAEALDYPQRLLGLHFFNPVAVLPLVELIRTKYASAETIATAFDVASRLRKTAVLCADAPAFVVNRLLVRFMLACADPVAQGNDFREVDEAVKALGLPMGPFELLGLVGPRVAAHVAGTLHEAHPDRFRLDPNFQMLADSGLPGVYDHESGGAPYEEITQRWQRAEHAHPRSADEIRDHALDEVAEEIRWLLVDEVVTDPRDIDTCMLLGAGWPFFMGGICMYLDQTGVSERVLGGALLGQGVPED